MTEPEKTYLKIGDVAFTSGAHIRWDGQDWIVNGFEDDTFYDGELVEDVWDEPYVLKKTEGR